MHHSHVQGSLPGNPGRHQFSLSTLPLGPTSPASQAYPKSPLTGHSQPSNQCVGFFFKGHLTSTRCHLGQLVVMSSSLLSLHLAGPGTSVPKIASTLVQPLSHTAASNWSMWTSRVRLSPIQLNSAISTSLSLHQPQRIELSMAFRLLAEPLWGRHLPQVSPRWMQSPTFKISLNHGALPCHRLSCPHVPHCQPIQGCHSKNLQVCVRWCRLPLVAHSCWFLLGVLRPCQLPLH
jgi:hypothetical protein